MPNRPTIHPTAAGSAFSDIEDIIADIRDGKMVIMVDDESRENEGDLLMAAEKVRPEDEEEKNALLESESSLLSVRDTKRKFFNSRK